MEKGQFIKTAMDINKAGMENGFNAMRMAQEQTETFLKSYWEQSRRISEEGTKACDEWTKAFQKSRDDFRNMIETSYSQFEDMLGPLARGAGIPAKK